MTSYAQDLEEWNRQRSEENRAFWGPMEERGKIWLMLGARPGSGRVPRLMGLGEEAGVPVLQASLIQEAVPAGQPAALLRTLLSVETSDIYAMRLKLDAEGPGIWLGYVPKSLGEGLTGPENEEDPLSVVHSWSQRLGFSAGAAFRLDQYGWHEPAGLKTAMVAVEDRGERFTIRLSQERGGTRWGIWSVHLGQGNKLSPAFMED